MVDLFLMDRLARSLRDDARLVLLGDAEQLPSVDAGAVLRDLLPGEEAEDPRRGAAVRLTHSFRVDPTDPTGRLILTVASAINEGRVDRLLEAESRSLASRASPAEIAFRGVELLEGAGARPAFLDRWYVERVHGEAWVEELRRQTFRHTDASFDERSRRDLERLFAHFEGARLLCVTRGEHTPTGAAHVNALLHAKAARAAGVAGASDLLPGEPVLVLENDYERGLFNGDQGIILWVRAEGAGERAYPMAVFRGRGGFAAFPLGALRPKLGLAYATTVHKSQGAEFDFVALLLPERDLPLCTRELLYTAVTRARRSVVLVGSREILASGARRRLLRFSGVGEKIARMSPCAARGPEARSESWTG
jgi:exodeoxyribonuclease V alpha subunit